MHLEEFHPEEFSREEEERRQQKDFKDFLVVREIAGTASGIPQSSRIPAEMLIDTGGQVELSHEHDTEDEASKPTVLIHRDELDDIESIEVLCTCGKRTNIRFKYRA
ncbi:MAG TPA: hypothetical protein VEC36_13240 [Patescibacteria group bacterium]|nr:hypothetical protein [Patescibacteria group bacterium]